MNDLGGVALPRDLFGEVGTHTLRVDRHGELASRDVLTLTKHFKLEMPFGDRLLPLRTYRALVKHSNALDFRGDEIILDAPDRSTQVVVNCPLTGVALNWNMARAVHTDAGELQDMVDRTAPLGMRHSDWDIARQVVFEAFEKETFNGRSLAEGLIIKVGGSSVSGFSSRATALRKKTYRLTEEELHKANGRHLTDQARYAYDDHAVAFTAALKVRDAATGDLRVQPRAPWWRILYEMGIEPFPDVDLQIYSPGINAAMEQDPEMRRLAHGARAADRWGRWSPLTVHSLFPELGKAQAMLAHPPFYTEFEYIPDRSKVESRDDWWTLDPNDLTNSRSVDSIRGTGGRRRR